jgi:hypothetical protein
MDSSVDDWIAQQADTEASSREAAIARFNPQYADVWTDPARQVHAVMHAWNPWIIRTGMSSYKQPSPQSAHLTHFVPRPIA